MGWLEGLVVLGLRGVFHSIALLLHFWRILLRYYYTFLEGRGQGKFYRKDARAACAAPENRERRTENGAPLRGDGLIVFRGKGWNRKDATLAGKVGR